MESPDNSTYLESPMEGDDVAYPCKGCGDILEEGKAFELAGNRWHLNCFRCNTCGTLLDSDANLLLLGDGSLICNNCTYSCSACNNKIEDLAILTGDQAFCATCFRCRNCKRKIENLRYARTSQGIFCMSCHESLMARRRKKSRAAANAKKKDDQSPMLVDKSLPALTAQCSSTKRLLPGPPRPTYSRTDSSSRSSSRKPREDTSSQRASTDTTSRDGLTLPTTTYRNNSTKDNGRSQTEPQPQKRSRDSRDASSASTPHIAFQEKSQPSEEQLAQIKDSIRRAANGTGTPAKEYPPQVMIRYYNMQPQPTAETPDGNTQSSSEKITLAARATLPDLPCPTYHPGKTAAWQGWNPPNLCWQRIQITSRSSQELQSRDTENSTISRVDSGSSKKFNTPHLSIHGILAGRSCPYSNPSTRPPIPKQQLSDTYMTPRAPPAPPSAGSANGNASSPNLPRWSAGGDLTMDEDMARIFCEASNPARGHGRSVSETTARTPNSPRWPKTPIIEDTSGPRDISSPISMNSPNPSDDPALLRRQLRNSEQRRKTVSVLDSQTELMIRQLEVLAGYVERAKGSKQPLDIAELEDSAIKEFAIADRDRALVEFEQLSSKNAQLADMNNDLTHQIQERFRSANTNMESPRPPTNGLGNYTHHNKDKSNVSVHLDNASLRPSENSGTTVYGSSNSSYPHPMEQDPSMEPATLLSAPHVVNIRKGQAKKFNWKKGGQTVAKGVTKGFKGAFSSGQERSIHQWPGQTGDSIGMPYNMTMEPVQSPAPNASGTKLTQLLRPRQSCSIDLILLKELIMSVGKIPSVVTRCIEEVELRGMDIEGIYRKTGGTGQVNLIKEGFDKSEDYDISDPDLDITAVTSVLKQYFRKLPVPLLTFDVYDRVLESISIEDNAERCTHLRNTVNMLPPKHRDCLEFLIFHLVRVAKRESENLMTPKNLAVVFAPTIMRDHSIDREMTDMHAKNQAVQFVIENRNLSLFLSYVFASSVGNAESVEMYLLFCTHVSKVVAGVSSGNRMNDSPMFLIDNSS
ncbi:hypothetical protein EYC84_005461 [Monilinia fructicola]|uniref:Rho-GAP domain-containing protein n=1 Tax=Monilinia fructicola TaxID=38448 RepID=A0A5M9K1A9_MONFR|nr:hypothetical protein EYC84_005461 [Monilinia fructicola]